MVLKMPTDHNSSVGKLGVLSCECAGLFNSRWAAEMLLFRGYPAAAIADKLHLCHFVFTHMFGVNVGCAAETTFFGIITWVAKVAGRLSDGTTVLTCMGHVIAPFCYSGQWT